MSLLHQSFSTAILSTVLAAVANMSALMLWRFGNVQCYAESLCNQRGATATLDNLG